MRPRSSLPEGEAAGLPTPGGAHDAAPAIEEAIARVALAVTVDDVMVRLRQMRDEADGRR